MQSVRARLLTCRLCDQEHESTTALSPGERALCSRCGTLLARGSRMGGDAALAFAATGLILAVPAATLPFITAEKLGNARVGFLFTGVERLWNQEMPLLAFPVFLFGALVPLVLLAVLAAMLLPPRLGRRPLDVPLLGQAAQIMGNWAMPEVQVLAVLVALMKLGSLVNVTIGPGFWCYAAMSFSLLLAWRGFELDPDVQGRETPASQ